MDVSFPYFPLTQQSDMDESVFCAVEREFDSNGYVTFLNWVNPLE